MAKPRKRFIIDTKKLIDDKVKKQKYLKAVSKLHHQTVKSRFLNAVRGFEFTSDESVVEAQEFKDLYKKVKSASYKKEDLAKTVEYLQGEIEKVAGIGAEGKTSGYQDTIDTFFTTRGTVRKRAYNGKKEYLEKQSKEYQKDADFNLKKASYAFFNKLATGNERRFLDGNIMKGEGTVMEEAPKYILDLVGTYNLGTASDLQSHLFDKVEYLYTNEDGMDYYDLHLSAEGKRYGNAVINKKVPKRYLEKPFRRLRNIR